MTGTTMHLSHERLCPVTGGACRCGDELRACELAAEAVAGSPSLRDPAREARLGRSRDGGQGSRTPAAPRRPGNASPRHRETRSTSTVRP